MVESMRNGNPNNMKVIYRQLTNKKKHTNDQSIKQSVEAWRGILSEQFSEQFESAEPSCEANSILNVSMGFVINL